MMRGDNQQPGDWGMWVLFGLLVLFMPGVFMALAVVALLAAMVVKAPRFTGALIVFAAAGSLIQFLSQPDLFSWNADAALDVVPIVLVFLLVIAAGWKLFGWGHRGGMASTVTPSHSLVLAAPRIGSITSLDDSSVQDQQAELEAAIEEARRIARSNNCGLDTRKRIFERVLRRECQQRGVKIAGFRWKRQEHMPEQALPVEQSEQE